MLVIRRAEEVLSAEVHDDHEHELEKEDVDKPHEDEKKVLRSAANKVAACLRIFKLWLETLAIVAKLVCIVHSSLGCCLLLL